MHGLEQGRAEPFVVDRIRQHPRELKKLKSIRIASFSPEAARLTHHDGYTYLLKQSSALTKNNLYAARAGALEGIGYAILPLWIVRSDIKIGLLRLILKSWTPEFLQEEVSRSSSVRQALMEHLEALHSA